jgi:steroid delta-isomerase-like uncharacterized protein
MADQKDVVRRFYKEVFDNGNVSALDELLTENAVEHEQPPPGLTLKPGREGVKELIKVYLDAFSEWSVEVHDQIQEKDKVVSRVTYAGTHSGTFAGIPATGKRVTVDAFDEMRFEGDRMAEHWGLFDALGMLTQMGVIPPMQ